MAFINGSSMLLLIDGTAVGSTKTCQLSISNDTPDTSNKGSSGWATHLAGGGQRSAEGSFEMLEDPTDTYGVDELFDLIDNRSDFDFQITDSVASTKIFIGTATITSLEVVYEMEQPVGVSGSFKVNGAVQRVAET